MTADGRPFSQHCSRSEHQFGGRTALGSESELKVGDVVGVQCDEKKTRCTVIWVMNTGPVKKNQVGVKLLADQECPWKSYLPLDGATVTISASNRRRWHRHKISLPLELRDERVKAPIRVNATDVSGNGCYVESMMPLPLGTVLRVDFWLDSEHISITAVVRTSRSRRGQWNRVHRNAPGDGKNACKPTWTRLTRRGESRIREPE